MNRIIVASAAFAASVSAFASSEISGSYNTANGYLAGKYPANGNRVTAFGAGAFGEGENAQSCEFFGGASGAWSTNLTKCAGLGYHSFRTARNMTECVGIGSGAFEGASGKTGAVWINGLVYAEPGKFWIKADKETADEEAPIYYTGGNLYLNAGKIHVGNGSSVISSGETSSGSAGVLENYKFYVSGSGNDYNDGLTDVTAFRSLDRAYEAATNGDTIAVMRGTYTYPEAYATNNSEKTQPKSLRFIGVEGAELTKIKDGKDAAPNEKAFADYGGSDGRLVGSGDSVWTTFKGFTFAYAAPHGYGRYKPCYWFAKFEDCVFDGLRVKVSKSYGLFTVCWLKNCTMKNCEFTAGTHDSDKYVYLNPSIFASCLVEGSYISFTAATNAANANALIAVHSNSTIYNSFVKVDGELASIQLPYNWSNDNFGVRPGAIDTTFVCKKVANPNEYGDSDKTWPMLLTGCLVGVDGMTNRASCYTSTIITNQASIAASFDGVTLSATRPLAYNYRHPEWRRWRFYGYGSGTEREARDAAVEEVCASLAEDDAVEEPVKAVLAAKSLKMATASMTYAEATTNFTDGAYSPATRDGTWTLKAPEWQADEEEEETASGE